MTVDDTKATIAKAEGAKAASHVLATLSADKRNAVLRDMADALLAAEDKLLEDNDDDIQRAEERTGADALPASTLARLRLTPAKIADMAEQIRSVAALPDPLGRVQDAIELDEGLNLTRVSVPLGVLAVIFEARPDAVTQIAALALKSGNAALLKPGSEVLVTAESITNVLREVLGVHGLPRAGLSLLYDRSSIDEVLKLNHLVDLVIPRGSKQLVEYIQANTRIPVLGHAEGVCHIYVDRAADLTMAAKVIADAKLDYPAACNAVETVLIHREIAAGFLPRLAADLRARGVRLHGDHTARALLGEAIEPVNDWHTEFGEPELAVGVVESFEAAVEHIHRHGSSHTEAILTEDAEAAERFLREVDAAGVFHNASTRFADGFRYGFGAEVGISTSKLHARGPVGLEGLTTYKYLLRGHGQVAGAYRGADARTFTHRRA